MDEGRSGRFVRLLLRHEAEMLRYALPFVGGALEEARDVVQDAAVALWTKFGEYDPALPFFPWARTFVRYAALLHHRKRRRYSFLSEELLELLDRETEDETVAAEARRQALEGCLGELPADDRSLVERRYRESAGSVRRVAEESGRTAGELYKALARIRRRLLLCVEGRLAADGP